MTRRMISTGARLAALALTTTGALALAACEEHPYPYAAPRESTAAPRPDDSTLAGAPAAPGGYQAGPTTRSPAIYPPPGAPEPYATPGYAQQGYPQAPGYGPPPAPYPPGYGHRAPGGAPPEIATMQPIPNPPERPHSYGHRYGWRRQRHHAEMGGYAPVYGPIHGVHHHHAMRRFAPVAQPMRRHHAHRRHHATVAAAPMHPHAAVAPPVHAAAKPPVPTRQTQAQPQLTKPKALDHHHPHPHAAAVAAAAAAAGGPTNTVAVASNTSAANTTGVASEADRYKTLEQNLRDVFANSAQLSAPSHMQVNQPASVTLTLPAEFAQMARTEAAKENLAPAVMTMNLVGTLAGDGYTIVPAEAQSLPLTLDTPTVFQWKVTPTGAGRGALKASVRAEAVGDGHSLALGEKSTGSGSATGRVVGVGLLALIALVLLGWAAQRRRPAAAGAIKPRASHTNGVN